MIPPGLAGVRVEVTIGDNDVVDVPVLFASRYQLNALLPSNTPLGDGTLKVTTNGVTAPAYAIRVMRTNVGLFTRNQQGFGPGSLEQSTVPGDVHVNELWDSARPNQTVKLWATGLGPVAGAEFIMPLPGDLGIPVEVYFGGKFVAATYAGRSGCCAGIDEIHFVAPENVEGCYVPVLVKAGGVVSNTITMAVSSQGGNCSDPGGLTSAEMDAIRNGSTVISSSLSMNRSVLEPRPVPTNQDYAFATFRALRNPDDLRTELEYSIPPVGSCIVGQSDHDGQGMIPAAPLYNPADTLSIFPLRGKSLPYLNAGTVQTTRGSLTRTLIPDVFDRYSLLLNQPNQPWSSFFDPGQVGMSNILPRLPVELFNETVKLPAPNQFEAVVQIDNRLILGSQIDRTRPVTVFWSGGDPQTDVAVIAGFKTVTSLGGGTQGVTATTWFVCTAPVDAGSFMVPSDVLLAMPTGKPTADPSGGRTFVPWIPGASLNDVSLERSSLATGIVRQPAQSRFSAPGISFGRLLYILTTRRLDLNYR